MDGRNDMGGGMECEKIEAWQLGMGLKGRDAESIGG